MSPATFILTAWLSSGLWLPLLLWLYARRLDRKAT